MYTYQGYNVYELQVTCETPGEYKSARVHIEAPNLYAAGWDTESIVDDIHDTFDYRCGHEHDCCGCWFCSVYIRKQIGKFTWLAELTEVRNI